MLAFLNEHSKRRMGEGLNDMTLEELNGLEAEMEDALNVIRKKKVGCCFFL